MEIQAFNNYQSLFQPQVNCLETLDDIPSFEDAFCTESLKRFYQTKPHLQPLEIPSSSFGLVSKAKNDDMQSDETSSQSVDDVETQASPLIRYMSKYSQETPFSAKFASNLNYSFYTETEMVNGLPQECKSACQLPSETMQARQLFAKPVEGKRVFEMKGNLKMTMSFGSATMKGAAPAQSLMSRSISQCSDSSNISDLSNFETLLKSKKIFKIEKEKPKMLIKHKSSFSSESNPSSPQIKTIKAAKTTIRVSKNGGINISETTRQEKESSQIENASFVNLLCHETKGLSIQKIEGMVLKL